MAEHSTEPVSDIPTWLTCNYRDATLDCIGRRVSGQEQCLAHLEDAELDRILGALGPGAPIDATGTPVSQSLLSRILTAVADVDGSPKPGRITFAHARFPEGANFNRVRFGDDASFERATFDGDAQFTGATFATEARFSAAVFGREAMFGRTTFVKAARFGGSKFNGGAMFKSARFEASAIFANAGFARSANYSNAQFCSDARFVGTTFAHNSWFVAAKFSAGARFDRANFALAARFNNAEFADAAIFANGRFVGAAAFRDAKFADRSVFDYAHFVGDAVFRKAQFTRHVGFEEAKFASNAIFDGARFNGSVSLDRADFRRRVMLRGAQFKANAKLSRIRFRGSASFDEAQFADDASFDRCRFQREVTFDRAQFHKAAIFDKATFERASSLGPFAALRLSFDGAVFAKNVLIEAASAFVTCRDTVWRSGTTLRLRYATVDLERATFSVPSFIGGSDGRFESPSGMLNEYTVRNQAIASGRSTTENWIPVLRSLSGVDALNLSITDVDLSECHFAGARVLDRLRLEGRCTFDRPPEGLRCGRAWPPAWHWTRRQSLAEERIWRANTAKSSGWGVTRSADAAVVLGPERLAALYRQLRKAQEDAKNEPGAADFYYGEMEMRRLASNTPAAERLIVWLYWLVSGYGLRALRSLGVLVAAGLIGTIALSGWGLGSAAPITTPPQRLSGVLMFRPGAPVHVSAVLNGITPRLPPQDERWTGERTLTSLEVTLDSFVFRATDQPLTATGTWITIFARIIGPALLGLMLLAIRNRIKR